jgi:replication factor C subunit 1
MGAFRCVLISGPPGIGKTTAAHLVAKLHDYDILELNASDVRSKKLLEVRVRAERARVRTVRDYGADR